MLIKWDREHYKDLLSHQHFLSPSQKIVESLSLLWNGKPCSRNTFHFISLVRPSYFPCKIVHITSLEQKFCLLNSYYFLQQQLSWVFILPLILNNTYTTSYSGQISFTTYTIKEWTKKGFTSSSLTFINHLNCDHIKII